VSQARVAAVLGGSAPEHGLESGSFPSKCVAAGQASANVGFVFFCVEMNLFSTSCVCCVFTEQKQEAQAYSKSVADLQAIRNQLQEDASGYEQQMRQLITSHQVLLLSP
jgi:hypothetical protein